MLNTNQSCEQPGHGMVWAMLRRYPCCERQRPGTAPSSHHPRWSAGSQLCGLWWTKELGPMSFLLEHRTQPCGALLWVDGEQFPAPTPSRPPHREVYVALLCASVLNRGRMEGLKTCNSLYSPIPTPTATTKVKTGVLQGTKKSQFLCIQNLWACRAN